MHLDLILIGVITLAAVTLFASGRVRLDLVALLVLVALALSGLVTPEEAVSGFSNPATVSVLAMLILSGGLTRTGAVANLGRTIARLGGRSEARLCLVVMAVGAVLSAFVNNTAVVAVLMPLTLRLAGDAGVPPSRLLMPLSFASVLGGTMTLIGTSTNLLVDALARREGLAGFTMFEFTPLGVILAAVGLVYMLLVGRRLLPAHRPRELTELYAVREYLTEIGVAEDSDVVGRSLSEVDLDGVEVLGIFRGDRRIAWPAAVAIQPADLLLVHGSIAALVRLKERPGLTLKPEVEVGDEQLTSEDVVLAEVLIAPNSRLRGRAPREIFFRHRFGLTILAIRRQDSSLRERLSDVRLSVGDTLLVQGLRRDLAELSRDPNFLLLGEVDAAVPRRGRVWVAIGIMVAVTSLAALGVWPILVTAVAGAVAMVVTGCLTMQEAYDSVDWSVICLLGGIIPLGLALEHSGAARLLADATLSTVGGLGPAAVLSAFYLLASLLTELMSNNATAVLLSPIAVATAGGLGVDPRPFLVAVAFAASASFMTPIGYQTNLLVYGPGGYRYSDYVRIGGPLNVVCWILAALLIPVFWPFH